MTQHNSNSEPNRNLVEVWGDSPLMKLAIQEAGDEADEADIMDALDGLRAELDEMRPESTEPPKAETELERDEIAQWADALDPSDFTTDAASWRELMKSIELLRDVRAWPDTPDSTTYLAEVANIVQSKLTAWLDAIQARA